MPDLKAILALSMPEYEVEYSTRDVILNALATGFSQDPMREAELAFTYEALGPKVSPLFASVLGRVGVLLRETPGTGLTHAKSVHGEIRLELHKPLPAAARLLISERIAEVVDKGADKGLLIHLERKIRDKASGDDLATIIWSSLYMTDGGVRDDQQSRFVAHALPVRAPDRESRSATQPNQALLYRLVTGDNNPVHASPQAFLNAGYARPLLHGLCTAGYACKALLEAYCEFAPERMTSFEARFSAPMFPGETIVTQMWRDGDVLSFRSLSAERNVVTLNNGRALLR